MRITLTALALTIGSAVLLAPSQTLAYHAPSVTVQMLHANGSTSAFEIATANEATGMSVAIADLGDDGVAELILGNGLGNEPRVHVRRQDGSEIGSFLAYAPNMGVGINIAVCDVQGDGTTEIITAPQIGGGPHVRVFSHMGEAVDAGGFFAYAESFRGGVNLACGDLDEDGTAELVTLPSATGGPHVRVWKWSGEKLELHEEFFAFDASDRRGLVGVVHDGKLIVSSQQGATADVHTYVVHSPAVLTAQQSVTLNATGVSSVYVHANDVHLTTSSNASLYNLSTGETTAVTSVSGSIVAANDTHTGDVLVAPARPAFTDHATGKYILVDLSDQRLYAYDNGVLANTFLISSGKYPYKTPVGNHQILAKLPYVYYAGVELDGTPWDLGNVPYNLRFYPKHYIHYAYWHNNFGHPMSHGCVNVNLENVKWIYEWAEVGVPVDVVE